MENITLKSAACMKVVLFKCKNSKNIQSAFFITLQWEIYYHSGWREDELRITLLEKAQKYKKRCIN